MELNTANIAVATETLAANRALQEAGRSIEKDVLDAMKALDDAKVQASLTQTELLLAWIELDRLKGVLVGK